MKHFRALFLFVLLALLFTAPGSEASWLDPAPTIKVFYTVAMGRQPTAKELEAHIVALEDQKQNLLQIVTSLFDSKECQDRFKELDPIETAYLKILGRSADGDGHKLYLDQLNEKKRPIEEIEAEMANSDEGKRFAIRQLYMAILNRDADEPGLDSHFNHTKTKKIHFGFKIQESYIPWEKKDFNARDTLVNRCRSMPDAAKSMAGSFEKGRFIDAEPGARAVIIGFFKNILGREPSREEVRRKMRQWALQLNLFDIQMEFLTCDEFKKRKLDEVETAWLRHMLRPGEPANIQKGRDRLKNNEVIQNIIKDLQWSDEGVNVLIRKWYWRTFNRDADPGGLKSWADKFKAEGRGRERYRDWFLNFLKGDETKNYRNMTAIWKEIADLQGDVYDIVTQAQLDFLKEIDTKFNNEKKEAIKAIEDLKKVAPAEFASMTYVLEGALAGLDLQKMQASLDKIIKNVDSLGPLLTGDVQKVFVELLGRPAPDFYTLLNNKTPAWDVSEPVPTAPKPGVKPAIPGNVPTTPTKPPTIPPTTVPTTMPTTPSTNPLAVPTTLKTPVASDVPGFEIRPGDDKLVADLGKVLSQCKTSAEFKEKLINYIVSSQAFKDRAGIREQAIVSLFGQVLQRAPTEKEAADLLAKLSTGKVSIADLRAEIEKSEEYQKVKEALTTGKIFPFLPAEKTKAQDESRAADGSIKDKILKLIDLEGFKNYDWAKEVTITDVVKSEDENGFSISGKASVPRFKLKDVKVFAKQHPSVYGYKVYIFGAFFASSEVKNLYDNPSSVTKEFLDLLSLDKGVFMHSSADVVLQMDSMPAHIKADFDELVAGTGYKSFRLAQGENLVGNVKLEAGNATKHLKNILPDSSKNLLIQGRLAKDPSKIFLQANLPPFKPSFFPKDCQQVEPSIEFSGKPAVTVRLSLGFNLPEKQPMNAKITFEVPLGPTGVIQLAASLDGMWTNPFNIKGFSVGNLVLTGKITVPGMAPTFGLGGDFRTGEKVVRVAASIPLSLNLSSMGFLGSINALGTKDMIALLREMGGKIEKVAFPEDLIGFKDVEVSFSAQADPVLKIPQGISFKGQLFLRSDEVAKVNAVISKDRGIVIVGTAKELKVGPLTLSGDGPDRKPNTADDGANIDILFPFGDSHAYLSGRIQLFGMARESRIIIDRRGMGFSDRYKVFNSWDSTVEVMGTPSVKKPDFTAKVEVKSDLAGDLAKAVDDVTGGHTPNFVKKIFSNLFSLRRAGFEVSLNEMVRQGQIPAFWIEFAVMGKSVNLNLDINFSDVKAGLKSLANKIGEHVDSRVREFVKEYLQAIADFFKRLFGKKKGKIDDLMAKFRNAEESYKDPVEEKLKQEAGELAKEYAVYEAIWSSKTNGNPGAKVVLQDDGNLVVLSKDGRPLWASGTGGKGPGCKLQMQDDGNLVIYKDGRPIWASNTNNGLVGNYEAVMQADGNYVIYRK